MKEHELRDLLREKAGEFSISDRVPTLVLQRGRSSLTHSLLKRGLALVVLVTCGAWIAQGVAITESSAPDREGPVAMKLLDDYVEEEGTNSANGEDERPSLEEISGFVACMRARGFDLPDPTMTSDGWTVFVENPDPTLRETEEWREAAFVDCRPTPPPAPGDLIMGSVSEDAINTFKECMAVEGFPLPEPTKNDQGAWTFDLSEGEIDFGEESWNRAVFVTCFPG